MNALLIFGVWVLVYQAIWTAVDSQPHGSSCSSGRNDLLHMAEDWMNYDNASGPCVVQAVIEKIDCSNIFEPDYDFMRRIAYVETKDGMEWPDNDGAKRKVGIWGLSIAMLQAMAGEIHASGRGRSLYRSLLNISDHICGTFGVNVTNYYLNPTEDHFSAPLASGLTARFYLSYLATRDDIRLPRDLTGQANFWGRRYRKDEDLIPEFEESETELKGLKQCLYDSCTLEEWTPYDNISGSCVVEAILKQLDDSDIFDQDHHFMRRIAYVETKDGKEPNPESEMSDNRHGIWGVHKDMIHFINNSMMNNRRIRSRLTEMRHNVIQKFGIDIISPEVQDRLRNPLVSAVVARFYVYYRTRLIDKPHPHNLDQQAEFWKNEYYKSFRDQNNTAPNFKERVLELEGCRVDTDIVFVLDTSHSVYNHFSKETDFVIEFIQNLRIGPADDRIGVVLFGTGAREVFNFSSFTNKDDIISTIESIAIPRGHDTNINEGLKVTREMFESDNRSSALRIAIVLSDGKSWIDNMVREEAMAATAEEAARLHSVEPSVLVYSIGIKFVNYTEMIKISGSETRYTHIKDFDKIQLSNAGHHYLRDICCYASTSLNGEGNQTVPGTVYKGDIVRYTIKLIPVNGLTLKICVNEGNVSLFLSKSADEDSPFKCAHTDSNVCKCQESFATGPNNTSNHPNRAKREVTLTEVLISIEGVEDKNMFTLEIIEGDIPTDCVGLEKADECDEEPKITNEKIYQTTYKGSSDQPTVRQTKKKTIVVASTTTSAVFFICCIVTLIVVIGWRVHRRQERRKQKQREDNEEEFKLLDNEYIEM